MRGEIRAAGVGVNDRYGLVLMAILASLVAMPFLSGTVMIEIGLVVVFGALLILVYRVSHVSRRAWFALLAFVGVSTALSVVTALAGAWFARPVVLATAAIFVASAPYVIGRRLLMHDRITRSTVVGALCIYLLVGQLFGVLYSLVALVTAEPFFVQTSAPGATGYLYFSYITLATVGYGDLTPATDIGRIMAMTEGLLGQLYLVTIVAVVVGNLGEQRGGARSGDAQRPDE